MSGLVFHTDSTDGRVFYSQYIWFCLHFIFFFQTTSTTAVIRDVGPGTWYEFRVAAVGINGTRGFSPPTEAFKLSKGEKTYNS